MQKFRNIILVCFLPMMVTTFLSCHAQKKNIKVTKQKVMTDTFRAEKNKKGSAVPEFNVITAQGKEMTTADLVKGHPVMLVLFNPSCGHCQILLEQVRDNIALYKDINIIFLTGKPLKDVLPNYIKNVKVENVKEINVVSDNSDITLKIFEYEGIPQIMLYDKEHKLQHIYYKDATNKQILQKLKK